VNAELRSRAVARLPILGVVAICFFLPCARGCGGPTSPLAEIAGHAHAGVDWKALVSDATWISPPFVTAAGLAVLLALAAWWSEHADILALLGAASLLAWAAGLPLMGLVMWSGEHREQWLLLMSGCVALPEAWSAFCGWRLLRSRGWTRWEWLLAAWAGLAAASPVGLIIGAEAFNEARAESSFLPGAWLYTGGVLAIAGLAARSAWRGVRRRGGGSAGGVLG